MKVVIKDAILRFNTLYTPKVVGDSDKARYSAAFLIKKGSPNDKAILSALDQVGAEKFGKSWKAKKAQIETQTSKCCYVSAELKGDYDGCTEDFMFLAANRGEGKGAPEVVDRAKNELPEGKMVNGDTVNAVLDVWAQTGEYTGLRCELQIVQFVAKGDPFEGEGGRGSVDDLPDLSEDVGDDDLI